VRTLARIHAIEALVSMPFAWLAYLIAGQAGILLAIDAVLIFGAAAVLRTTLPLRPGRLTLKSLADRGRTFAPQWRRVGRSAGR